MPSTLEIVGDLTGLVCVYLTVRNQISNWIWGIANVLLFGVLFYQFRLYSDMALQLAYFLPMQFYGWWLWKKAGPRRDDDLPVTTLSLPARLGWLGATVVGALVWGFVMATRTNAAQPYTDAAVAAVSVTAQYLDARKKLESWWLWIAVDVVSAFYLYPKQHLYLTAGVYAVFLALAVAGLVRWRKLARSDERL